MHEWNSYIAIRSVQAPMYPHRSQISCSKELDMGNGCSSNCTLAFYNTTLSLSTMQIRHKAALVASANTSH